MRAERVYFLTSLTILFVTLVLFFGLAFGPGYTEVLEKAPNGNEYYVNVSEPPLSTYMRFFPWWLLLACLAGALGLIQSRIRFAAWVKVFAAGLLGLGLIGSAFLSFSIAISPNWLEMLRAFNWPVFVAKIFLLLSLCLNGIGILFFVKEDLRESQTWFR